MDEKNMKIDGTVTEIAVPSPSADPLQSGSNRNSTAALPTAAWPVEPTTLIPDQNTSILAILFDTALVLAPILLLVKIALVLWAWELDRIHRNDYVDYTNSLAINLVKLNGQLITLFTIIFVTIVSTTVRRFALYKAQQGAYVAELEQLQGSTSLPSTLKLIWSLRAFSTTSLALIGVWSFYYLGSQANKLEFQYAESAKFNNTLIGIQDRNIPSIFDQTAYEKAVADQFDSPDVWTISDMQNRFTFVRTSFSISRIWTYGQDAWQNPVLPNLGQILLAQENGYQDIPDPEIHRHGWVDVSSSAVIAQHGYVTLVGTLFYWDINDDGNSNYRTNAGKPLGTWQYTDSYFDIQCGEPVAHPFSAFPKGVDDLQPVSVNMTNVTNPRKDADGYSQPHFDIWWRWDDQYWPFLTNGSMSFTCAVSKMTVDVKGECLVTGCAVKQMRWANDGTQESATSYNTPFNDPSFDTDGFFTSMLYAYGPSTSLDDTDNPSGDLTNITSDYLIANRLVPLQADANNWVPPTDGPDVVTNYTRDANAQITFTINTWYKTTTSWVWDCNPNYTILATQPTDGLFDSGILHGGVYQPQYTIEWPWLILDVMSCTILFAASVVSVRLRLKTLAPDILGSVSSLTRDNPYIDLPHNGSTLDGLGRARLLKSVKIKLGDVGHDDGEVGRVAMVRVDHGLQSVNVLTPSARYV